MQNVRICIFLAPFCCCVHMTWGWAILFASVCIFISYFLAWYMLLCILPVRYYSRHGYSSESVILYIHHSSCKSHDQLGVRISKYAQPPTTILPQEGDVVCHGVHYAVVTSFPSRCTLRVEVEVEAKDGSGRWVGDFSKQCELK